MATVSPGAERTAWLYTRGEESVTATVDHRAARPVLIVRGPGSASATHDFTDLEALLEFAEAEEQRLRGEGFRLQALAERRTGQERRQVSRPNAVDRRR